MTTVRAWYTVSSDDEGTFEVEGDPDDIGAYEVEQAVAAAYQYDRVMLIDYEIVKDAA